MAYCTLCSFYASSAEVASSNIRIEGFLITERAKINLKIPMAILCFWPPESFTPRYPTKVSSASGNIS
jgi:hypothetical protein